VGRKKRPVRVEISAAGHNIVLESAGGLNAVASCGLQLWRDVHSAAGPAGEEEAFSVGFAHVSEPVRSPLLPPEAELPHRLQPDGDSE